MHKIHLNCDNNDITWNRKNYLLRAAKRIGLDNIFRESGNDDGAPEEYILNIEPCHLLTGHKWTGLWHIDVLLDGGYHPHYGTVDTLFLSSDQGLHQAENGNVLFQAIDTEIHKRYHDPSVDFVLCGSMGGVHSKREERAAIMKKDFTYIDHGKDHTAPEYIQRYSDARVQWIQTGLSNESKGAVAQRFFECLAIGPVLTNWSDDLPLTGLVENEDYMAYRDEREMVDKMKKLVEDKDLRDKIAYNGRKKGLLAHTYEHRLISILNEVNTFIAPQ